MKALSRLRSRLNAPSGMVLVDLWPDQVLEIFDGDAPHAHRGCITQAWSVAKLLRAAVEDVYEKKDLLVASAKGV